jgi:hypothetical protein
MKSVWRANITATCMAVLATGIIGSPATLAADERTLPNLPPRPADLQPVPDCHDDYLALPKRRDRALSIRACIADMDARFRGPVSQFPSKIAAYRNALVALYAPIRGDVSYTYAQRTAFHGAIEAELRNAGSGGPYMATYDNWLTIYDGRRKGLINALCVTIICKARQP